MAMARVYLVDSLELSAEEEETQKQRLEGKTRQQRKDTILRNTYITIMRHWYQDRPTQSPNSRGLMNGTMYESTVASTPKQCSGRSRFCSCSSGLFIIIK
mmetsp:Transcript_38030/g.42056  ORF Transcript_38030/g.42056 Transcript_38030/m.42056 type:complete len:100 (-) Transcript_38030:343-642(-)